MDLRTASGTSAERTALQSLVITRARPGRKNDHYFALWWEHEAQCLLRALRPALPPDQELLLMWDGDALAGVAHLLLEKGAVQILAIGVALPYQGKGIGSSLLSEAVARWGEVALVALAHRLNARSQSMLERRGFRSVRSESDYVFFVRSPDDEDVVSGS